MTNKPTVSSPLQAISVDVEEHFHAANLEPVVPPRLWHAQESRVVGATEKVLELFNRCNTKGTFFVLGYCARRHPRLVRSIVDAGHELASHGYAHRIVYTQSERHFFRDIERTKKLLEDISGTAVLGYRAPNFSITDKTPWAYDCLCRAGYRYDSSRYPVRHPRYANSDKSRLPEQINCREGSLYEFPLATSEYHFLGAHVRIPVAGGAYWRLLPRVLMYSGLKQVASQPMQWANCYFHPWELDSGQPRFNQLSFLTKLRHYGGVTRYERTLEFFLQQFRFGTIRDAAKQSLGSSLFDVETPH